LSVKRPSEWIGGPFVCPIDGLIDGQSQGQGPIPAIHAHPSGEAMRPRTAAVSHRTGTMLMAITITAATKIRTAVLARNRRQVTKRATSVGTISLIVIT